jgi:phosphohistidine phosphatase
MVTVKTVLLLRHAKAERGPEYPDDVARPLAGRGKRDATQVGEWMAAQGLAPNLVISSPAKRARQTARRCADAVQYAGEIRLEDSLYVASEMAYLELMRGLDDRVGSVLLVGHNPDIAVLVERLSGQAERMPTAALARIDLPIEHWSELAEGQGKLAWVHMPGLM